MKYDVVIIGAGPSGLSFAKALTSTNLKIAVIEKASHSSIENPEYDGREIALTHLSYKNMLDLGQLDLIPDEHISLIRHAKVLNGNSQYSLNFDCTDSGKENLGFMVSNHLIRKAAFDAVREHKNIELITDSEVKSLSTNGSSGYVILANDEKLDASLIVAADSRFSTTRRMMGISTNMLDFGRVCIVCKMKITGDHNNTALEWFQSDQTLAILPLNNSEVSVVITVGSNQSQSILTASPNDFSNDIESRTHGQFGEMKLSTELYPYPLVATYARRFYTQRFALIGDAAVGMHPVTAHGFNLGLRSAIKLAEEIKTALKNGQDYGARNVLEKYNRSHFRASRPLYLGTNALVKLYTQNYMPAKFARSGLLRLANRIKPAKQLIMNQLTETRL